MTEEIPYSAKTELRNAIRGSRSPEDFIAHLRSEQKTRDLSDDELREYVQIHRDQVMAMGIGLQEKAAKPKTTKAAKTKAVLSANIDDLLGELDAL